MSHRESDRGSLDGAGNQLADLEKRFLERVRLSGRPLVRIFTRSVRQSYRVPDVPAPDVIESVVKDISTRGIALIACHPIQQGTTIYVELPHKRAGESGILAARVRHCTALTDGDWILGCSLSRELRDDEVTSFFNGKS